MRLKSVSDKPKNGILTGSVPLIVLAIAAVLLLSLGGPTSAQFFNFGGFQQRPPPQRGDGRLGGGWFGNDTSGPFQQRAPQPRWHRRRASTPVREDFSRAPPPEKRDTVPERNVLVLGDAMADWLAYGLEDAYTEQPAIGVIRKVKTISGLIQYQPKGAPADWAAAARNILANENPDVIVVMLGLNDRMTIREPAAEKSEKPADKNARKPDNKPRDVKPKDNAGNNTAKPDDRAADDELPQADAENTDAPPVALEKSTRSPNGIYEFRDSRWVELYTKKIDEMIAVTKSKGVPVVWVGLPAIIGQKSTSDSTRSTETLRGALGSPMSISGTDLSTRQGASCRRAPITKARSASCAPMTASISPSPARANSPTMSSARSPVFSLGARTRLRYPPSLQPPPPKQSRSDRAASVGGADSAAGRRYR